MPYYERVAHLCQYHEAAQLLRELIEHKELVYKQHNAGFDADCSKTASLQKRLVALEAHYAQRYGFRPRVISSAYLQLMCVTVAQQAVR